MNGNYWIGQDGQVWVAGVDGVNSAGAANSGTDNYWQDRGYTPMVDPVNNSGPVSMTAAPSGTRWLSGNGMVSGSPDGSAFIPGGLGGSGAAPAQQQDLGFGQGGGGGGTNFMDTTKAREGVYGVINSLDSILANKQTKARGEYQGVLDQYDSEDSRAETDYNSQVGKNETNRETNRHSALLSAAQGSRGLHSTLASIGALGGTGRQLANRAVAQEANTDIGRSDRAFGDNAEQLLNAWTALQAQQQKRRDEADTSLEDTLQANRYDTTEQRQNSYKEMADLWTKAGNNANADKYMGKANSLTKDLVSNTRPNVTKYNKNALQYDTPGLKSYLAGANDMTVDVRGGGNGPGQALNSSIFANNKRREEELV